MSPSGWGAAGGGGGGGGGRSRGKASKESVEAAVALEYDKLTQPCFEGFLKGAWWEVQITQWRSDMFLVVFKDLPDEEDAWVSIDNLRLRARKCDEWDCPVLRKGVDVSVYDVHPQAENMIPPLTKKALYDAKIVDVDKSSHHGACCCKFFIRFYSIKAGMSLEHGVDRVILKTVPAKVVDYSSLVVLQQPWMTPLDVLLKAHISESWDSEEGHRLTSDAYFLKEIELKMFRNSGEESITTPFGDFLADMSGEEGLPNPDGRLGTAQHCGASKAPFRSPVSEPITRHGTGRVAAAQKYQTREVREVNEVDHQRGKNRAPLVTNFKYHDRGVKRKHDSVEEKEISNIVQEDYSPGVSSRFARSKEMAGSGLSRRHQEQNVGRLARSKDMAGNGGSRRQQEQNVRRPMNATGHESLHHRADGRMDPKSERRSKMADREPSRGVDVDVISDSSENVNADSGHSSERGSTRDVFLKRRRPVEEEVFPGKAQTHRNEQRSSRYDPHQKVPEQVFKSKSYGVSKKGKFVDMTGGQWPMEDIDEGRYCNQRAGKRNMAGNDPKLDKAPEEEYLGRRRGSKLDTLPEEENSGRKRGLKEDKQPEEENSGRRRDSKLDRLPEEENSGRRRDSKLDRPPEEENSGRRRGPKVDTQPEEEDSGRRRGPKVDNQPEEENLGRKRGRPRKSLSSDRVPRESPQAKKDYAFRSRHTVKPENREESPNANFETRNNVTTAFGGSPEIETGRERSSRRDILGKQDKVPERTITKRLSERLQKVSPVKLTPPKKGSPEKGDNNDPHSPRTDGSLSSSSQNSDDPANAAPQHRKLRPRVSLKANKSLPTSKSNRLHRDADKEKRGTEKAVDRPLYLDLLVNNEDDEKLCPATQELKPPLGLKPTWVPVVEDVPSDSDSDCIVEKTPLAQKKWAEFDTATTPAVPSTVQEDAQAELHDSDDDLDESKCDHKLDLKDDVGLVCTKCGVITTPIEDVVPEVEIAKPRVREADVDEWDLGRYSPEVNEGAVGNEQNQVKNEQVGTMLDVSLPPHYAKQMHPHQKEGFEFLWRNLGFDAQGNLRNKRADRNAGCALSHAPGTGKSFLIISFLKSYMDKFPNCQPLIVAPKIMLLRWEKEFQRWKSDIRTFILNTALVTGKRLLQNHIESGIVDLKGQPMNPRSQVDMCRMALLLEWKRKRSVCLVSYNLFSHLTDGVVLGVDGEAVRRTLLEAPGILILDEGHFPRNKKTNIRRALMKVKTNARILLSGTLFQNNFEELFNTLYLVRPGFAEAFSSCKLRASVDMLGRELKEELADDPLRMEEAENRARKFFVEEIGMKIEEGQLCKGSEELQHGLQRLQRLTANFVHHYTGEVLACLPGLRDFGILLKPTALQGSLLEFVEKRFQRPDEYLKREIAVSEASIHPKLLTKLEFVRSGDIPHSLGAHILKKETCDPQDGVKTKFVFDLISSLKASGHNEKVLIFSQHITPLDLLEDMFKAIFNWDKNKDLLRLDGQMALNERETIIELFNGPRSQAQVLLASTKACGEGINLVGASRVVFLDVLWNPAVIKQAISRAFRLGQKKTVYVYRLIAFGSIEEKKYKKAIQKDWLSMSIFSPVAGEADEETDGSSDLPESDKTESRGVDIRAWEVDASTCEDDLLEKLLKEDKSGANSFLKVVEHGNQFHNRKTACGPDASKWFLEDKLIEDLPETKETTDVEEALGMGSTNPKTLPSNLYEDFEEIGAFGAGADGSSDTDEEIAYDGQ